MSIEMAFCSDRFTHRWFHSHHSKKVITWWQASLDSDGQSFQHSYCKFSKVPSSRHIFSMRWILHLSKSSWQHIFHCILQNNSSLRYHFWITWMKLTVPVKAWKKPFQQLSGSLESLCMLIEHALTSFKGVRNEGKCLQEHCLLNSFSFISVSICAIAEFVAFISS